MCASPRTGYTSTAQDMPFGKRCWDIDSGGWSLKHLHLHSAAVSIKLFPNIPSTFSRNALFLPLHVTK
jgi:hypothetical protein